MVFRHLSLFDRSWVFRLVTLILILGPPLPFLVQLLVLGLQFQSSVFTLRAATTDTTSAVRIQLREAVGSLGLLRKFDIQFPRRRLPVVESRVVVQLQACFHSIIVLKF